MARTPRIKHLRHREVERVRHSSRFLAWLAAQATRLVTSTSNIFNMLVAGATADQVESTTGSFPWNTVIPEITGTAKQGSTLTATDGTWTGTPAPSYTRTWRRDGVIIPDATATTYVLTADDVGATISVAVTATNTLGAVVVSSLGVGPVIA